MKIEFIFFHGQESSLPDTATDEIGFIVLKKKVARQLPGFHGLPDTAVFTAGLAPAICKPYLSHGLTPHRLYISSTEWFVYQEDPGGVPFLSPLFLLFSLPYFLPFRGSWPLPFRV